MDELDEPQPQPASLLDHLAAGGAEPASEPEPEPESEDGEDAKKGIPLGTKVALIAAGWVLLTLFLIGVFNKDDKGDSVRLSQAPGAAATEEDGSGDEGGDGPDGDEPSDGNGVEEGDADATVESYPGRTVSGSEAGTTGTTTAGSGGGGSSTGSGGSPGGGGSTASTARPGSGGGGGGGTGSSTTVTTTKSGGGGSSTTTTTAKQSPSTTTTAPAAIVTVRQGQSSPFSTNLVQIASGQTVRFDNADDVGHTLTFNGASPTLLPANGSVWKAFTQDTTVRCPDIDLNKPLQIKVR